MKSLRVLGLFLIVFLTVITLPEAQGQSQKPLAQNASKNAVKNPKIALLLPSLSGQIYVGLVYGTLDEAKKMGLERPIVLAAGGYDKLDVQMKQVEDMMAVGVNAIIIMPLSKEGMTPVLDRAVDAGIKVLELGNETNSKKVHARVRTDQVTLGRKVAEAAVKELKGKGNVVMFNGPAGASWSRLETEGFKEVIKNYPDIKILAEKWTVYDAGVAMNTMNDLLQTFPKIDYIYTAWDTYAEGAASALEAAGKKGKIPMGTIQLTPSTLKMLKEGVLSYVVGVGTVSEARQALQTAYNLTQGIQVPPLQFVTLTDYYSATVKANPNIDTQNDFFPEGWTVPK
jgi:ABC-type sugar transport system substrate-binding protein